MFGFLRRGPSEQERFGLQGYLREIRPFAETIDSEYQTWMTEGTADGRTLSLEKDSNGQHAAVYLYRVDNAARDLVASNPPKRAERYHEALALCLEARGAAADLFREAADLAGARDPAPNIAEANRKIAEGERLYSRAQAALSELQGRIAGRG